MKYIEKDFDFAGYSCFFAFDKEQYNVKAKENIEYKAYGYGLYIPKKNFKEVVEKRDKHAEKEKKKRIKIEGLENIVLYELNNHECYYTGHIDDSVFDLLAEYGASKEDVIKLFKNKNYKIK